MTSSADILLAVIGATCGTRVNQKRELKKKKKKKNETRTIKKEH